MRKPLRGVALIIGEADYAAVPALPNPTNDADLVAALFTRLGFEVTLRKNQGAEALRRDLDRFAEDAAGADVAAVYYSGHGIEAGGENWLVPTDADLSALDGAATLVAISPLMEKLSAAVPVTLIFLDACRTDPFPAGSVLKKDGQVYRIGEAGLQPTRGGVASGPDRDRRARPAAPCWPFPPSRARRRSTGLRAAPAITPRRWPGIWAPRRIWNSAR